MGKSHILDYRAQLGYHYIQKNTQLIHHNIISLPIKITGYAQLPHPLASTITHYNLMNNSNTQQKICEYGTGSMDPTHHRKKQTAFNHYTQQTITRP